jgi:hypothetical protein
MLRFNDKFRQKGFFGLILVLIIVWSLVGGGSLAVALNPPTLTSSLKSVDPATGKYTVGQELYLENCSGCHIPIPPAVLPTETWEKILENPQDHYGERVEGLIRLTQVLIWDYVSHYSRPLAKDEARPKYIAQSRYFKALHPQVDLPEPTTHRSCVGCHPRAIKFDYRTTNERPTNGK